MSLLKIIRHNKITNYGRIHTTAVRISSNIISRQDTITADKRDDYVTIYKFPYIRAANVLNRLKVLQASTTAVSIPIAGALYQLGHITNETAMAVVVLGITGTLTLMGLGMISTNLIGFVYMNKKDQIIKISHTDFWGRRCNTEVPLKDLIPRAELPGAITDPLYVTLHRYSNKQKYKLVLKLGMVLDKEKFESIFGDY